jgi:hypothetical protein
MARRVVVLNLSGMGRADLETVDALARLGLVVRRCGSALLIENAADDLADLLRLAGLDRELGLRPAVGVDARRQPEHREEADGVQEEGDAGDPVA